MPITLAYNVEDIEINNCKLSHCFPVRLIVIGRRNGTYTGIKLKMETEKIISPKLGSETTADLELSWGNKYDDDCRRDEFSIGQTRLAEDAAIGVAGVLFPNVVDARFLNVLQIGDSCDYLIGTTNQQYVLEISGSEQIKGLNTLHKRKVKQLLKNDKERDGYVVVCGFKEKRILFSFHKYGEGTSI